MLFENVFQWKSSHCTIISGCDLMLFENVFQSLGVQQWAHYSCDLMLFENVFQWLVISWGAAVVVIWCSLRMSFSTICRAFCRFLLWFDALWECLSVRKDYQVMDKKVVIWCSLRMSFSKGLIKLWTSRLWFDALWECLSVSCAAVPRSGGCDLMLFENVFQCEGVARSEGAVVIWCSLRMSFSL